MSVTVNTASGSTTVNAARVTSDSVAYALQHQHDEVKTLVMGDRLANPSGVTIEFEFQEATLAETAVAANDFIVTCRSATSVDTWRGNRLVDGVLSVARASQAQAVTITVVFAPEGPGYT